MTAARNIILDAQNNVENQPKNKLFLETPFEPVFLKSLNLPDDLKTLNFEQLRLVASEIRSILYQLSERRSVHFASNLGVVELAIALHSLFDFTKDHLIWDTGHQCYPHKILTGRLNEMNSIRTLDGLMGYPNPDESIYDLFMTGHAGCSAGTAIGLTCADDLLRPEENRHSFAIIGDGAMASGIFFEALNQAGGLRKNLTVILNDNKMSICKRVGGLGHYLDQLRMNRAYLSFKSRLHRWVDLLPAFRGLTERFMSRFKMAIKAYLSGGMLFEEFGFRYIGPINGHDIKALRFYLKKVREYHEPVLLHILTEKGHGFRPAELDPTTFHAPSPETVMKQEERPYQENISFMNSFRKTEEKRSTEEQNSTKKSKNGLSEKKSKNENEIKSLISDDIPDQLKSVPPTIVLDDNWDMAGEHSFTHWARNTIYQMMQKDQRICVITAAMTQGNMLEPLREAFPDRFFDVGICESHAIVFAAGLAKAGMKPIVDIYSTFLQRGYDHLFQEVSLQNLPIIFMLDRSGVVGADGPTHHGVFDIAYLRPFPNLTIMSPGDSLDLQQMLPFALELNRPVCIRYPKTTAERIHREIKPIQLGEAEILRLGQKGALVVCGGFLADALAASDYFAKQNSEQTSFKSSTIQQNGMTQNNIKQNEMTRKGNIDDSLRYEIGVINARFVKPLDFNTILTPLKNNGFLVTVEEGILAGGFGSAILEAANEQRLNTSNIVRLGIADQYVPHGSRKELLDLLGLNVEGLIRAVHQFV
ncbi:MAG: 1-deoxy-D-xylulose-5-phosphate synthase [Planctomycetia bacterium]|nr:1-deoxy-D-xylulose-5-phosphate synthase [Planctomycetia bacterium]